MSAAAYRLEPFFLPGSDGALHATFFASVQPRATADYLLIVPPFAEEMNKCRPMMAALARRVAAGGMGALLVDLYGTGDSAGDFGDATWERWREDLRGAMYWLERRGAQTIHLLAVRSGALLAAELGMHPNNNGSKLALWQPIVRGADFLRQFFRLRIAADAFRSDGEPALKPDELLRRDGCIEIAGYRVSEKLANALSASMLTAESLARFEKILWADVSLAEPPALSLPSQRALQQFSTLNVKVDGAVFGGEQFWSTPEIAHVPALLDATRSFLVESHAT